MRQRTLLGDTNPDSTTPAPGDTHERVRRTLDEALAELQLPMLDRDDSGLIKLHRPLPSSR